MKQKAPRVSQLRINIYGETTAFWIHSEDLPASFSVCVDLSESEDFVGQFERHGHLLDSTGLTRDSTKR